MVSYLLTTLLFMNLIASGVYLLYKGLLLLAKEHVDERFRYIGCIAVMLLFLIPFYQVLPHVGYSGRSQDLPAAQTDIITAKEPLRQAESFGSDFRTQEPIHISMSPEIQKSALVLWASGTVCLGVWYVSAFCRFRRKLFQGHGSPVPDSLQQTADLCARECGLRQKPQLIAIPEIQGPMMIGFFKPMIAIPSGGLPTEGAPLILKHELVHFKRHDLWWKLLGVLLQTLYWFNPIVWMLCREFEFCAETSCDAEVVQTLDRSQRKQYGYLLISYVSPTQRATPMPGISFTPARNKLKRRISIMLNGNKSQKVIAFAIVGVLAASSFALSAFAAENQAPATSTIDGIVTEKSQSIPSNKELSGEVQTDIPFAETIDPSDCWKIECKESGSRFCEQNDGTCRRNGESCNQDGTGCSRRQANSERAGYRNHGCRR